MNRRQYSNQGQGFQRQRNFERSKFYSQNNNFRRFNNQNSNNNNINRDNYRRRNNNNMNMNMNNMNNMNNNNLSRNRRRQNNQPQNISRPYVSLGRRARPSKGTNMNNQNNQNNQNNGPRRQRYGNGNQNFNNNAPMKRQVNRQARRFQNDKQKRKNEGLLYVTNLSEETINTDLKEVFESYGRLKRCAVFFDLTTNQSKCRGVVQFTTNVNAQKAKNDLNGKFYIKNL